MELDPVIVGIELKKLKVKNPTYYQAHCPACKSVNKVSVPQMKADLDAVADEIEARAAEIEKAKAEAKAAKKAAAAAKRGADKK
jgi:phage FluMu protein Com